MADNARVYSDTKEDANQKHRTRQQDSESLLEQYHGWDQGLLSLTETPFFPQMDQHAAFLASSPPGPPLTRFATHLQQTYGNRYVQRLVESVKVQPKLNVNAPSDIYEQEADRVADKVMKAVNSPAQRQPEEEEEEEPVQMMPLLQRQEEEEELQMIHRQPVEEEEELRAKSLIQRQEEGKELQAQLSEIPDTTVSETLETIINHARGSGHPLSDNVREPMENAFGVNFSNVRVHTDSEGDVLNQQLNAKAFTTGQDIFFRGGEYSPGSDSGQKLIAHELTHVVQQTGQRKSQQQIPKKRMVTARSVKFGSGGRQPVWGSAKPHRLSAEEEVDGLQRMAVPKQRQQQQTDYSCGLYALFMAITSFRGPQQANPNLPGLMQDIFREAGPLTFVGEAADADNLASVARRVRCNAQVVTFGSQQDMVTKLTATGGKGTLLAISNAPPHTAAPDSILQAHWLVVESINPAIGLMYVTNPANGAPGARYIANVYAANQLLQGTWTKRQADTYLAGIGSSVNALRTQIQNFSPATRKYLKALPADDAIQWANLTGRIVTVW